MTREGDRGEELDQGLLLPYCSAPLRTVYGERGLGKREQYLFLSRPLPPPTHPHPSLSLTPLPPFTPYISHPSSLISFMPLFFPPSLPQKRKEGWGLLAGLREQHEQAGFLSLPPSRPPPPPLKPTLLFLFLFLPFRSRFLFPSQKKICLTDGGRKIRGKKEEMMLPFTSTSFSLGALLPSCTCFAVYSSFFAGSRGRGKDPG